jgi:hypothetical protein
MRAWPSSVDKVELNIVFAAVEGDQARLRARGWPGR